MIRGPLTLPLLVASLAACGIDYPDAELEPDAGTATDVQSSSSDGGDTEEQPGSDSSGASGGTGETGDTQQAGLPCEVADLLERRCQSCHGATPVGAPMSLVSHDDLVAPSFTDGLTFAERAMIRMASADNPMPPAPASPATPQEQMAFAAWVEAGMRPGDCVSDPEPDPFDAEPTCSTDRWWDPGDDDGTPLMFPGRACLGCHTIEAPDDEDVPDLVIGGTVFETAHEPDDCKGPPGEVDGEQIIVEVTSADGQVVSLSVNASGNFLMHASPTPFPAPYLVKVVQGDRERAMPIPAESGDCNGCHTQDGDQGAPGRIVLP